MNRRNYSRELDKIIENNNGFRPSLLLHACCGPCSTSVLEKLVDNFDVTVLWYNPNIYPEDEFYKRLSTLNEVIEKLELSNSVKVLEMPWNNDDYKAYVTGLESEPEGGKRCERCFELRIKKCAELCKKHGFDYFCTTLTVSRHKDAVLINSIGERIAALFDVKWLPSDFKKKDGENRSVELSEKYGIYRQKYCGCQYSLENRERNRPTA